MSESIACFGVHTRTPRVHVPAFPDIYLQGVDSITGKQDSLPIIGVHSNSADDILLAHRAEHATAQGGLLLEGIHRALAAALVRFHSPEHVLEHGSIA